MIFLQASSSTLPLTMFFYIAVFGIMYFFFLRPNVKKRKEQESFSDNVSKGQEVVTTSGIIGRVNKIEDNVVYLQVDQKTFIKVLKDAISKDMTELYNKKPAETE